MKPIYSINHLRFLVSAGLLVLASGYAVAQNSPVQAGGQPATPSPKSMDGCGMMVDGKMVYKDAAGKACMNMNKPGNAMPNGVTMHSDPGVAAKPK